MKTGRSRSASRSRIRSKGAKARNVAAEAAKMLHAANPSAGLHTATMVRETTIAAETTRSRSMCARSTVAVTAALAAAGQ